MIIAVIAIIIIVLYCPTVMIQKMLIAKKNTTVITLAPASNNCIPSKRITDKLQFYDTQVSTSNQKTNKAVQYSLFESGQRWRMKMKLHPLRRQMKMVPTSLALSQALQYLSCPGWHSVFLSVDNPDLYTCNTKTTTISLLQYIHCSPQTALDAGVVVRNSKTCTHIQQHSK